MADFYDVLGVTKNATKDDIKKAYRKAALKTHPDRAPQDQKKAQEDAFRSINAAYEVLSDDNNRALFDKHGKWPPPQATTTVPQYQQQRAPHQNYQPASNVPLFYDHGRPHAPHFTFTDPFVLFNAFFAEFNMTFQQQQAQAAAAFHRQPPPPQSFPEGYPPAPGAYMPFPSFGQAAPTGTFAPPPPNVNVAGNKPRPRHSSTSPPAPPVDPSATSRKQPTSASAPPSTPTSDDETRGWVKESRVMKMAPDGRRETTVKKTAFDGTVYITRIAGDGTERHWIVVDGVEKATRSGAPAVPPRMSWSQTQVHANPGISGTRPSPTYAATAPGSAAQAHSSSSRHPPHARSQSHSVPAPSVLPSSSRERSASRSASRPPSRSNSTARPPIIESDYRVASPTPLEPRGTGATGPTYPYAYAKASVAGVSASSSAPQLSSSREREKMTSSTPIPDPKYHRARAETITQASVSSDPRRHNTAPGMTGTYQAAPAPSRSSATTTPPNMSAAKVSPPMPRPQSPHFYRTRVSPEKPPLSASSTHGSTKPSRPSGLSSSTRVREDPSAYPFSDSETRPRASYGGMSAQMTGYQSSSGHVLSRSGSSAARPSRSAQTYPGIPEDKYSSRTTTPTPAAQQTRPQPHSEPRARTSSTRPSTVQPGPAIPAAFPQTASSSQTAATSSRPATTTTYVSPVAVAAAAPKTSASGASASAKPKSPIHPQAPKHGPMPAPENSLGLGFVPPPAPSGGIAPATPAPPPRPFGSQSRSSSFERIVYAAPDQPQYPRGMPFNPMPQPPQMVDPWSQYHHRNVSVNQWQPV